MPRQLPRTHELFFEKVLPKKTSRPKRSRKPIMDLVFVGFVGVLFLSSGFGLLFVVRVVFLLLAVRTQKMFKTVHAQGVLLCFQIRANLGNRSPFYCWKETLPNHCFAGVERQTKPNEKPTFGEVFFSQNQQNSSPP